MFCVRRLKTHFLLWVDYTMLMHVCAPFAAIQVCTSAGKRTKSRSEVAPLRISLTYKFCSAVFRDMHHSALKMAVVLPYLQNVIA
jgi:hypothetical protein